MTPRRIWWQGGPAVVVHNSAMEMRSRLDSWKEIAKHLGRDVRTVIRWEQQRGLPVYRVPGGKLPRVFAYPDELDRWLEGGGADANGENGLHVEPGDSVPPPAESTTQGGTEAKTKPYLWAAGGLGMVTLAALAGAWVWGLAPSPPTRLAIVGNELLALDNTGRTQWTHRPAAEIGPPEMRWTHVADLDGDGRADPLASVEVRRTSTTQHGGELLAFTDTGDLRWSLAPADRLRFRDGEYGPPWPAKDLVVYRSQGAARIAWSVHHFTWFPGMLITLDADGNRLGTFVNSGWIRTAVPSLDERTLIVTGTNNGRQTSFVAILDAASPGGHSPEPPGSPTECLDCPDGDPLAYYLLPRTDVSQHHPFPGDGPTVMTFDTGLWQVHSLEGEGPNIATIIYEFGEDASLQGARPADSFWEWHKRLEGEGRIAHNTADCPHRNGLEVQRWTAAAGWETLRLSVR